MSKKSFIDTIEVKDACSESWNEMKGNDQVRFCGHCAFEVNNISALTRKQAMRLVRESDGRICVRYIKHPVNSAPVFADKLYQITRRAGIAAGVLGASLTLSTMAYAQGKPVLINKNTDAQNEQMEKEQAYRERNTFKGTAISFSGTITDSDGAVIPNATVTITNVKTNESRTAATNDQGIYNFENVAAARYKIQAHAIGFKEAAVEMNVYDGEESGASLSLQVSQQFVMMGLMVSYSYSNPLFNAVSNDDLEEIKNLIAKGENVNAKDENYDNITALFLAVENGSTEIVETLLNFGAKINAKDDNKQTPLMRLDEDASPELVRVLIKHGAKINLVDKEGNNALILVSRSAKQEVLQILLKEGAKINAQNREGRTALMEAADADNIENIRALLEAGADVNLKDKSGETALSLTTDKEIEKLLADYGAIIENE